MATSRPNVLFVLTDQERYDLTAPDGPPVETLAFDRLSSEGVRFERAYTPISICTSARASMLTGLYPHNHGMLNNCHEEDAVRSTLPTDLPTFSERLADAGYDCSYTGKWHVGHDRTPEDFGFSYLGGSDRHHDDIDDAFRAYRRERETPIEDVTLEDAIYTGGQDGTLVAGTTPVDVADTRAHFLAERTLEMLDRHTESNAPFFHRIDFYGPHHPYVVPEPYASQYDPDAIEPWDSYAETFDGKPAVHEQYTQYRGVADFGWETWAEVAAKYWGFQSLIDAQVGRILEGLDDRGLAGETIVVHASDHGDFVGNHRQFNKGPLMYEDTYRVPLQVRWPGVVDAGTTRTEPVSLVDLAPTFLELCDVPVPDGLDGHSLRPLLEGQVPLEWRDAVAAEYHGDEFGLYSQRMIRTERYKFVYNGPDTNELYDLESDPAELRNLIDHPEYENARRKLARRLVRWMHETDDPNRTWVPGTLDG
ncbi:sulfatase-like hydrolase/transferase [Natrialbaceae archaeon AArc-T1-2]|uniref:sulfatase-like hydrolase/transferase n=1 Tax=Natrialbaceae archaeon AArc-T1-2 TaxID=3053904 RepID=UPI00255B1A94|nr:sulfatase-like hydrolase/transferase [Natrialbaceae archaeon AArc-T1-2]WIV66936.1 sulfatase-like hydrolase/transferase [Natrialbaceae archaeon AArc-T1-2]